MKKFLTFALAITAAFSLVACKSDIKISLKEKCASYIETEESRFTKKDDSFAGIFYSEKLESCVSKWLDYSDYTYRYFDVLTNEFLTYIRYTTDDVHSDYELTDEKAAEYEQELLFVR